MKAVEKLDRLLDPRLKVLQDRKTKRDPWVVGNLSNFEEKRSTKVRSNSESDEYWSKLSSKNEDNIKQNITTPSSKFPSGSKTPLSKENDRNASFYKEDDLYESKASKIKKLKKERKLSQLSSSDQLELLSKESELESVAAKLKEDSLKYRMLQYGFRKHHKLCSSGDSALLVCYCIRLLQSKQVCWEDIEERFSLKSPELSTERTSLLHYLYEKAESITPLKENLLLEAQVTCPDIPKYFSPIEKIRAYISTFTDEKKYFGITEMAAGAYRDQYVLVIVREDRSTLEVVGIVAPLNTNTVYYCLFHESGYFDLLEPESATNNSSIFQNAPKIIKNDLEELYQQQVNQQLSSISKQKNFRCSGADSSESKANELRQLLEFDNISSNEQDASKDIYTPNKNQKVSSMLPTNDFDSFYKTSFIGNNKTSGDQDFFEKSGYKVSQPPQKDKQHSSTNPFL